MNKIFHTPKILILFTLLFILTFSSLIVNSQNITITDDDVYTADPSAMLDVKSTTKGLLIPRLTTAERTTLQSTAAIGLLVFDTDKSVFYYFDGTNWVNISKGQVWTVNSNYVLLSDSSARVGIGTNTPNSKLEVQADASFTDLDTLFAVKDKNGDVVFAVFPDGAKVFVNENAKGKIGGFAISGRSPTKGGLETDIFIVTQDSTRIFVNDTLGAKGKLGGFAVSGRSPTKGISNDYFLITGDSTRLYVNDSTNTKGKIGGFAISGRSPTKGPTNDYMKVTKDSTRVYVTEDLTKGKLGGFAISGRSPTKGTTGDYFNVSGNTGAEIVNNESRIMWYPQKAALLAGEVHVGSADSVGSNSMAMGYRAVSKGQYSQAMGYKAQALGLNSTAIGYRALAKDTNSFAFGNYAEANGINSFAFGDSAIVEAQDGYAIGAYAYTAGRGSFAIGSKDRYFTDNFELRTTAIGDLSIAVGLDADAIGDQSVAVGNGVHATGLGSVALGRSSTASGDFGFAMKGGIASGPGSMAIGGQSSGQSSITIGSSEASGWGAVSIGFNNTALSEYSLSLGSNSDATGDYATSIGTHVTAQSWGSFVTGYYNVIEGNSTTTIDADPLFVIGNGKSYAPANALTILHNGEMALGNITPSARLHVSSKSGEDGLKVDINGTTKLYVNSNGGTSIAYSNTPPTDGLIVSGNVGIGTTSPVQKLDVRGNIYSSGNIGIGNSAPTYNFDVTGIARTTLSAYFATSSGNVGIGTTSPTQKLDVRGNVYTSGNIGIGTTSPVQKLDVRGNIYSSGNVGIGASSPLQKLDVRGNIYTTGYIGIGTSSPGSKLDIVGFGDIFRVRHGTEGHGLIIDPWNSTISAVNIDPMEANQAIYFGRDIAAGSWVFQTGSVIVNGAFTNPSDLNLKKNIQPLFQSLDKITAINGVSYEWKNASELSKSMSNIDKTNYNMPVGKQYGVIAQEIEKVLPELVYTGPEGIKSVDYIKIVPFLIESIKEQQNQIEDQDKKINSQQEQINILIKEIENLKKMFED